jgi:hypothetical protein
MPLLRSEENPAEPESCEENKKWLICYTALQSRNQKDDSKQNPTPKVFASSSPGLSFGNPGTKMCRYSINPDGVR